MTGAREQRALGLARIALGALFLARTTPLLGAHASPLLGWPTADWTVPAFGPAIPGAVVAGLCVLRTLAAVLFTLGVRARLAGIVAACAGHLVLAQDRFAFVNSLHILFLGTFVVALTSGTSAVALVPDAPRASAASSVRFVSIVLASIYFWAGVAKLQPEWLSGRALEAQGRAGMFAGPLGGLVERVAARAVASWTIPALELCIAALLLADRRRTAIVLGLVFHGLVELAVEPDTLGWQLSVLLLALWPRADRFGGPPSGEEGSV